MTITDLNDRYFALFGELYSNRSLLPEKQRNAMSSVLMKEYEQAVQDYLDERELEFAKQRFELKFKVANYTPRRRLFFWWNPIAKKLLKQYKAEFLTYIAALEKSTREEKKYATELRQEERPTSPQQQLQEGQSTALTPSEIIPAQQEITP